MTYRFWFLLSLSLLLIITFGFYLPLRFEHQAGLGEEAEEHGARHHAPTVYHEDEEVLEGLAVNLKVTPVPPEVFSTTTVAFLVNLRPEQLPLPAEALEIEHQKLMHVLGVRNDLNYFFHLHPEATATPGLFTTDYFFEAPGLYKIWSEVKYQGRVHTFGHPKINVAGLGESYRPQIDLSRNVIVGDYQVALRLPERVSAGREVDLLFDVHTLDSFAVELADYLGEPMHLVVIKDDLSHFLHGHPTGVIEHQHSSLIPPALANGGGHDTAEGGHGVRFELTFPAPGFYKLFAQFRPAGIGLPEDEALTASFWVEAVEKPLPEPLTLSQPVLVFLSLVLIFLLGWGVRKFINA